MHIIRHCPVPDILKLKYQNLWLAGSPFLPQCPVYLIAGINDVTHDYGYSVATHSLKSFLVGGVFFQCYAPM